MSLFSKENVFHFAKELIWWVITLMIAFAVVYPILQKIDYIFIKMNMFFVFLTITYFRWTVSIRHLPFLQPVWVRFALFALNVSLFVFLMGEEQKFLMRVDNFFVEDFGMAWKAMSLVEAEKLLKYIYNEIVLFGTSALIMIFLFNARIIVSAWQFYKHKADRAFVNN